jgi:hypothetical protein
MTIVSKRVILLVGLVVSAVHFTLMALLKDARLFLQRPEDMVGTGDSKPFWPPNQFADMLEVVGQCLRWPLGMFCTQNVPDSVAAVLLLLNSGLWGLALSGLMYFAFSRRQNSIR